MMETIDSRFADMNVLVADDEDCITETVDSFLKHLGFEKVKIVDNGAKALTELLGGNYDLCITDTNMPELKGYEVIQKYKKSVPDGKTKFIGCSGLDAQTARSVYESLEVPFLEKPIRIGIFDSTIRELLR